MLTAIAGETLREGMEIVSTAQILNRSDSSGDGSSATAGGENPFAPKMPPAPQAEHRQHENGSLGWQ